MEKSLESLKLCDSDYRFMMIVWENAPVKSGELVGLCKEKLGWKKSTTYTVIKKLCDKGYIQNQDAMVSVLIPKEKVFPIPYSFFLSPDSTIQAFLPLLFLRLFRFFFIPLGDRETGNEPVMRNETVLPSAGAVLDDGEMKQGTEATASKMTMKELLPKVFSIVWISGIGVLLIYTFFELIKMPTQGDETSIPLQFHMRPL